MPSFPLFDLGLGVANLERGLGNVLVLVVGDGGSESYREEDHIQILELNLEVAKPDF